MSGRQVTVPAEVLEKVLPAKWPGAEVCRICCVRLSPGEKHLSDCPIPVLQAALAQPQPSPSAGEVLRQVSQVLKEVQRLDAAQARLADESRQHAKEQRGWARQMEQWNAGKLAERPRRPSIHQPVVVDYGDVWVQLSRLAPVVERALAAPQPTPEPCDTCAHVKDNLGQINYCSRCGRKFPERVAPKLTLEEAIALEGPKWRDVTDPVAWVRGMRGEAQQPTPERAALELAAETLEESGGLDIDTRCHEQAAQGSDKLSVARYLRALAGTGGEA